MPDLTAEDRIKQFVKRGIAPTTAERIVAEVDAAGGNIMQPDEAAREAEITDVDKERARQAWYYNPAVPVRWKRILDARKVSK